MQEPFVLPKLAIVVLMLAGLLQLPSPAMPVSPFIVQPYLQFTVVDVEGRSLRLRQVAENGDEIDRITITKPASPKDSTLSQKPAGR